VPDESPRQARQLVLVGGGHAHVAVLKALGMQRMPEVRLVLISPHWDTPYSGMLPALIAGHYTRDQIHVDLHRLCRFAGGEFCHDQVVGLDLKARKLQLAERPPVHFDLLSINSGSTPATEAIPGVREFAVPVKPIDQLLARLAGIETQFLASPATTFRVVTVGGGAGGVELTLSLQHRLEQAARRRSGGPRLEFTVITASPALLAEHNPRVRARFTALLAQRGVRVLAGTPVVAVSRAEVTCADGSILPHDALFWATHAAAPEWPRAAGLAVDDRGFIAVDPFLRSTSHDLVYAAGDVAAMIRTPRAKSGVFAVRQGPPLARNLRLALMGFNPRRYRPQRTYLSLISTGDQQAVASKGSFAASGRWLWRWKQRIDQKWMRRYRELPEKTGDAEMDFTANMKRNLRTTDPGAAAGKPRMRCGGCGAKIGGLILHAALKQLNVPAHPNVMIGLNAPDDAAVVNPPAGRLLVQSVDFFRTLINDPWLFGRITANHALNDLYAMGATPMFGQATVTLELADERIMVERLAHLLAGAAHQLAGAGASLIGGHSGEGRETALGLSVTGSVVPGRLFRKTGLRPGDVLIITKPLGTGVLFAADMALKLSAARLPPLIEAMLQSSGPAAAIFANHGVTTATDISGFGLLGHLREMIGTADLGIQLWPTAIPWFDGVRELAAAGHESTMVAANLHYLGLVGAGRHEADERSLRPLLDPQTAGPLLAAVAGTESEKVVAQLREAGYPAAAVIGRVTTTSPGALPFALAASP